MQRREHVERRGPRRRDRQDRLGGVEIEAAPEHRALGEDAALARVEQVPGPVDGALQRRLSLGRAAAIAREKIARGAFAGRRAYWLGSSSTSGLAR